MRLAWRNKTRFHVAGLGMAGTVTFTATANSALHAIQQLLYGRRIAETEIDQPPLFVIGHWRSGTTMLHEMLALNERFAFPTTYECFAPSHFVLTHRVLPKLMSFLLPSTRPMDNMPIGFDHPQEDEFALVAMGLPSPILRLAFPNDPPPDLAFLDMEGVEADDLRRWQEGLTHFVRMQTYLKQKPIILKSPPHTGRVEVLSKMFPGAKFVHIVRDPYALFPSSRRLWYALDSKQAFQMANGERIDDYVFEALPRMYNGFERQREKIDPRNICDVHYESLVQDPVAELRRVYEQLELGDFEELRPQLETYVADRKEYRPNTHELEPEIKDEIRRRWASYFEKYGYS